MQTQSLISDAPRPPQLLDSLSLIEMPTLTWARNAGLLPVSWTLC